MPDNPMVPIVIMLWERCSTTVLEALKLCRDYYRLHSMCICIRGQPADKIDTSASTVMAMSLKGSEEEGLKDMVSCF